MMMVMSRTWLFSVLFIADRVKHYSMCVCVCVCVCVFVRSMLRLRAAQRQVGWTCCVSSDQLID